MAVEKKVKKVTGSNDTKLFKELKKANKLLKEMRELLDNIWRERRPQ